MAHHAPACLTHPLALSVFVARALPLPLPFALPGGARLGPGAAARPRPCGEGWRGGATCRRMMLLFFISFSFGGESFLNMQFLPCPGLWTWWRGARPEIRGDDQHATATRFGFVLSGKRLPFKPFVAKRQSSKSLVFPPTSLCLSRNSPPKVVFLPLLIVPGGIALPVWSESATTSST